MKKKLFSLILLTIFTISLCIAQSGEWIILFDGHSTDRLRGYKLTGFKVVEYEIGSPEMIKLLSESKFKNNPGYGKSVNGLIMFQHHGQKVWLRKIKVRRL